MTDHLAAARRVIVKIGSALLVDPANGALRRDWLEAMCDDLAALRARDQEVLVVSSGAVALGRLTLGWLGRTLRLEEKQAAASVGQIQLAYLYQQILGRHGITVGQILLTLQDTEARRRHLNARATLNQLLSQGVIPVINENDTVTTSEIRFGDNDRLAARVAQAADANGVVLLSDIDGLYDRNPALPGAVHIPVVERIDRRIEGMADRGSASGMGSGGMVSKIEAARIAASAGVSLAIASGRIDRPLSADTRHTMFMPEKRTRARKAWLAGRLTAKGSIAVDAGAAQALAEGRSLLAIGATAVRGMFFRGDLVTIEGPNGPIARGLAEYDAADAQAILGSRSEDQGAILGYAPRAALVHRNHMALL